MLCTFARYDTIVSHIGVLLHTAPAVVATTSTILLVAAPAIVLYVNLCTLQFMPLHCGPVCLDEKAVAMEDDDRTGIHPERSLIARQ